MVMTATPSLPISIVTRTPAIGSRRGGEESSDFTSGASADRIEGRAVDAIESDQQREARTREPENAPQMRAPGDTYRATGRWYCPPRKRINKATVLTWH